MVTGVRKRITGDAAREGKNGASRAAARLSCLWPHRIRGACSRQGGHDADRLRGLRRRDDLLVRPITRAAHAWVDEHLPTDATWFCGAVVVEHRYIGDIVAGKEKMYGFMESSFYLDWSNVETCRRSERRPSLAPWLRINRVLRVMLHTHFSAEPWSQVRVEFRKALALRGEIRRAGWFN